MEYVKFILFTTVMIYAGIIDYKTHLVPKHVYLLLLIIGAINVDVSSLVGMIIAFIPLFIVGLASGGLGGGDIKVAALCGFILKGIYSLIGIGLGLTFGLVLTICYRRIKKKSFKAGVALVPYFAMGTILTYFTIII